MKIKTGLLAYGMSGKIFHAPFLEKHDGFDLYAIVERTDKKAQEVYPHLRSYNSTEELLDDDSIELVIVNTPNNLHYENTKSALLKGKHVLVEKPFAANTQQAKELFELADKQQKKIFFYQNRRWDSDFLSVKKILDNGELGKLNELHIRYDRYKAEIGVKSFKESAVEASGLSYDLGPHLLDQVISLFGKPLSFHKVLNNNREGTKVNDYIFVQLSYPNSLNVTICASLLVVNPQPAFVLHGSKGSYIKERTDLQENQLLAGIKPGDSEYGMEQPNKEGLLSIIDNDTSRKDTLILAERGNYMEIFDAVYQSLNNNMPYPITREDILTQLEILES